MSLNNVIWFYVGCLIQSALTLIPGAEPDWKAAPIYGLAISALVIWRRRRDARRVDER